MHSAILLAIPCLAIASAQTSGQLGDAPTVTNNPQDVSYVAMLPSKNTTTLRGSVTVSSPLNGRGADYVVTFTGVPSSGGPFMYHIHDQLVPADGNCTKTLAHFDPYVRGESPPCDSQKPATCQIGDLSGKYGNATRSGSFTATYNDPYTSLNPASAQFIGNRSIVFHFGNKTRISCANFVSDTLNSDDEDDDAFNKRDLFRSRW